MFGSLGPMELGLIVVVALVLFGGGRIASLGKGLGQGIKNFKSGLKDDDTPAPEPEAKKA
jgi:sec-independent protein translocase protein TatA